MRFDILENVVVLALKMLCTHDGEHHRLARENNEGLEFDIEDEITRETLVIRDGQIIHPRIREGDSQGDD